MGKEKEGTDHLKKERKVNYLHLASVCGGGGDGRGGIGPGKKEELRLPQPKYELNPIYEKRENQCPKKAGTRLRIKGRRGVGKEEETKELLRKGSRLLPCRFLCEAIE